MTKIYKIADYDKEQFWFLYHGTKGSRKIKLGEVMVADIKSVTDGSGSRPYESGFHVFKEKHKAIEYLNKFKKPSVKVILEGISVGGALRQKESNNGVFLADKMILQKPVMAFAIKDLADYYTVTKKGFVWQEIRKAAKKIV